MWLEDLQSKVASTYSNITFVKSEDDKRIKELIRFLEGRNPLNPLYPNKWVIDTVWVVDGAGYRVIYKRNNKGKYKQEDRERMDDFTSPFEQYVREGQEKSVLIYHKFLSLSESEQTLLLCLTRDTEALMSKQKHIIIFTESFSGIAKVLLENSNIVEVPLSLDYERREMLDIYRDVMPIERNLGIPLIEGNDYDSVIRATSGLNLIQFESLLFEGTVEFIIRQHKPIVPSWFAQKKVEILNRTETFRIYHPKHGLDAFASPKVLKEYIQKRIINVIKHYDIASKIGVGFPDGLLLFGMQGTGKTWLARAIAKEVNVPFVEFNIASVMSKYVGETEKNIEKMIKILNEIQPAILFIDEIDAIGLRRSTVDLDSGVSRRMINRLMSWLAEPDKKVLVIGSTNKPEQMDEAFIRSGRFSFRIPLLLPNYETRKEIFKIHLDLRGAKYDGIDFDELARRSAYYTGADIVKIVDDALFYAFDRVLHGASGSSEDVKVCMDDFDESFKTNIININRNSEQQKMYIKLAEDYGTDVRIIDIYKNIEKEIRGEWDDDRYKLEIIKQKIKGD